MKKTVFTLIGLFLVTFTAFSQISTLPYSQNFDNEFTTGDNVEFIPNWIGNEVGTTNRIFRETTTFNSTPAAMAIIPTGGFNGEVIVDFNLAGYSDVSLSFVAKSMANGDGNRPTKLEIATSTDGGTTWIEEEEIGEFPNEDQASFASFTYDLPASANQAPSVKVRFSITQGTGGSGTRAKLIIDDVIFDGEEASSTDPILTLTPATLDFAQTLGAPSATQSVSVYGANLANEIALTVTTPFEIALTEDGSYALTQTLSLTDGGFSGNVFVRLNSTSVGEFTGTLTAQTTGITPITEVTLNGEAAVSQVSNPTPFDLSSGNYSFTEWDANSAAETYPNNMIFWINNAGDGVESTINDEYVQDWECFYNVESASRILGEGANGVAFLNTGNTVTNVNCYGNPDDEGRIVGKPGATVLALNTLNRENIEVSWTGRTLLPNNRIYALRLQYRIGDGDGNPNIGWTDFDTVSEYVRNETEGHSQEFTVNLPEALNNQEIIQLRWVYFQHQTNTATGSRAKLALDEVSVTSEESLSVGEYERNSFSMYPNPASDVVSFNKEVNITIFDINGKKVLAAENISSINISELSKGVYFVKTSEGVTKKLIKR